MNYGLVAIVKDEGERIDAFLDSAMAVCNVATIVDTGSTDQTVEQILVHRDTDIALAHRPWVNFGRNRSEALLMARGTADWLLALDADMTVEIDPDFEPDGELVDAYMIRMGSGDFEYRLPLLLKGDLAWESRGAVHEYTTLPDRPYVGVPTDKVRVTTHGDRSGAEKSAWHLTMLEAEFRESPDNARTVFYIAQTLRDLGRLDQARAMYERRSKMIGWDEETFYAKYRFALLVPTWPARMQALMAAWEFRPIRLEPLYEIIRELNYRGQHHLSYRLAQVPNAKPPDHLFLHNEVYRWGMDFERSIAEWHAGSREVFEQLSAKLLDDPALPDHIRGQVLSNLTC